MSMYTELLIKAQIRSGIPEDVEHVLQHLFNGGAIPQALPDHPFFKCVRWPLIGRSGSHYHVPFATRAYREGYLFSRSDLKNYGCEIKEFISWVKPYIDAPAGACIGWEWYEEDDYPTLILM